MLGRGESILRETTFETFVGIREPSSPRFLSTGRHLLFVSNRSGATELWSVPTDGGPPTQLTACGERITSLTCSPTLDVAVIARDFDGSECDQLHVVQDIGGRRPTIRPLAGTLAGSRHLVGAWSPDGQRIAFTANREDPLNFGVYTQGVNCSHPELVWPGDGHNRVVDWAPDGRRLLVEHWNAYRNHELRVVDVVDRHLDYVTRPQPRSVMYKWASFTPYGVICASDLSRDYLGVLLLGTSEQWLVAEERDVEYISTSQDRTTACYVLNDAGYSKVALLHVATGGHSIIQGLPDGVVTGPPAWSRDGTWIALSISRPTRPQAIWLVHVPTATAREVVPPETGTLENRRFVSPKMVSYRSFDRLQISALYYPCPSADRRTRRIIVAIHGGPESQERPEFNVLFQYFLARGYSVLAPNIRGSTGFGHAFEHLDDGINRRNALTDVAFAARWCAEEFAPHACELALYGESYGGYVTLAGLTNYPRWWKAGVDVSGISDLETFLRHTHPSRRRLREAEYGHLGRDRDVLRRLSPIHDLDKIVAPLLVIHGRQDPRVPISEAEQVVSALQSAGQRVQSLLFEDEGHCVYRLTNQVKAYDTMIDFLDRYMVSSGA